MELRFAVGWHQRYAILFPHDRFWGRTLITVDGQPVLMENKPFAMSLNTVKQHQFRIGPDGEHLVLIEIKRKRLLGGLRPMRYRTFVDGVLVDTRVG